MMNDRLSRASCLGTNAKRGHIAHLPLLLATAALLGLVATDSEGAYVSVSSRNPFLRKKDSGVYGNWYFPPVSAALAKIEWQSGKNVIAGVEYGPTNFGPEPKFAPGPPVAGTLFTGYVHQDEPVLGAAPWVYTGANGSSATAVGPFGLIPYFASWRMYADYNDAGGTARCYGISWGYDPWPIFPAAFAQDTLSHFDLYVPIGMIAGSAGGADSVGRFEYAINYVTAQETTHLLEVRVTDGYVQAKSPDNPPGLAFYTLGSQDTIPTTAPDNLLSLGGIRSELQARMQGDGFTDSLVIGVFWPNVPVPTSFIRDSTLAEIEVNSSVELGTRGTISSVPSTMTPRVSWLAPPMPNPMESSVKLTFKESRGGQALLAIFDVRGRLVKQLMNSDVTAGEHVVQWNGRDAAGSALPPGVYFLRLRGNGQALTRRLVLLR